MFEAVHGSAPDIAGKDIANPSGLINGAIMMLGHLGQHDVACTIKNALLCTLEDGLHTADIYREGSQSKKKVGTTEFADALISRLGKKPQLLPAEVLQPYKMADDHPKFLVPQTPVSLHNPTKTFVGVDIFVDWESEDRNPNTLAEALRTAEGDFKLQMISNRGVKVWPNPHPDTYKVDHWRCRFMASKESITPAIIPKLMQQLGQANIEVIKTENLYNFDSLPGYSLGQGQ
uniref:Isocitrate dehydrogenase [NADP] n=1 Tax=Lotus japonicus TaxID=34305 RepID=I3T1L2_LOTJA|nr:unknown [Lotus japonicus]